MRPERLPTALRFDLNAQLVQGIQSNIETFKGLAKKFGDSTSIIKHDDVEKYKKALVTVLKNGPDRSLAGYLVKPVARRAFTGLLSSSDDFNKLYQLQVNDLKTLGNPVTRLNFHNLCAYYFKRMQPQNMTEADKYLCTLLKHHLSAAQRNVSSRNWYQHAEMLLSENAFQQVCNFARERHLTASQCIQQLGLNDYRGGTFEQAVLIKLLFDELESAKPSEEAPQAFSDLQNPEIKNRPWTKGWTVGLYAAKILIDRANQQGAPSESWRTMILQLAGDPRLDRHRDNWVLLGQSRRNKVMQWLAAIDLELFLKVLEDISHRNAGMRRMFPKRKRFLEGLLAQNLVLNTRVYIPETHERLIRSQFDKKNMPEFALVKSGAGIVFIYLQVGDIHIFEGSHNCKIRLLPELPQHTRNRVLSFEKKHFQEIDLKTGLLTHPDRKKFEMEEIPHTHSDNFIWESKVLEFFKEQGINCEASEMFDAAEFRRFRSKHWNLC